MTRRPGRMPNLLSLAVTLVLALFPLHAADAAPGGGLRLEPERTVKVPGAGKVTATPGRLSVPEVRSDPASRTIELAFVRLHSSAPAGVPPLVYLEGGPGGSSTGQAEEPRALARWAGILDVCDVILLDQRGTGSSEPRMGYRWEGELPARAFSTRDLALGHFLEMSRAARASLIEHGIDLRGYTSVESADDIDDLRRGLREESVSLLGFSYGTHLALATIRRHGEHVASAILVGTEGPDHTWKLPLNMDVAFERLSRIVAADPHLGKEIPDLTGLLDRVLARLDREPIVVSVEGSDGRKYDLAIGSFGLKMILRWDIGDASDLPVFPRLLWSVDRGDTSVLRWFVLKRAPRLLGMRGMSMLVDGASAASPERLALIEAQAGQSRFADVVNFPFPDVNEVWQPRDVGDEMRGPLISDVRSLFLSGTLDWNTPPQQAEEVRWGFRDATHLVVTNAGHEQILTHPEVRQAVVRFLRGEDVRDVHAAWPPLRFVPLEGRGGDVTHPSVR